MKTIYKFLIHVLISSLVLVPFSLNAAMITTDKALSSTQSIENKNKVNEFFNRTDVIAKFESMGVTPQMAQERINAMTQAEVNQVAKNIGDTIELALEPVDAFGEYDAELVQVEPTSAFPQDNLKEGAQFEGEDETGEIILYTVTNIADGKVVVDGNHPWAGQRIIFKATIKDVRSANQEEVSHQHVHGAGGHHH